MSGDIVYERLTDPIDGDGVVLVAQAAYHLDDLVPVREALLRRGLGVTIVRPRPRPSVLRRWRSSWWRYSELSAAAARSGLAVTSSAPAGELLDTASAIVVRNDWGVTRELVDQAARHGVATIGWVEGVQDFADADTGWIRRAYRAVDHVLCLGEHDRDQLVDTDATIVGSERMWRVWNGPVTTADGPTVANVNFTYGVSQAVRTRWVNDVLAVGRSTRQPIVLSRHPADRGRRGYRSVDRAPVEQLLARAPGLISRFSTLCYEALARGVDLTYHNPHGERVNTFAEPDGAFRVTRGRAELLNAVSAPARPPADVRRRAESFLRHHLVLDDPPPSERASSRIAELAGPIRNMRLGPLSEQDSADLGDTNGGMGSNH